MRCRPHLWMPSLHLPGRGRGSCDGRVIDIGEWQKVQRDSRAVDKMSIRKTSTVDFNLTAGNFCEAHYKVRARLSSQVFQKSGRNQINTS